MVIAPDGSLRGTLTFTSITAGPVPIRVRNITGSKLVQELGPYHSPTLKRDVVATSTAELKGDSLTGDYRSEEHTSELQSLAYLVCRLLLEKKKIPRESTVY